MKERALFVLMLPVFAVLGIVALMVSGLLLIVEFVSGVRSVRVPDDIGKSDAAD